MSLTSRRNNKKKEVESEETSEDVSTEKTVQNLIMLPGLDDAQGGIKSIGLFGDINEEKGSEIVYALLTIWNENRNKAKIEEQDKKSKKEKPDPIELYISTHGGSASDMFAIYDIMRQVKKDIDISTIGVGKVMSAGVLLLAAGSKGKRKIGKNCRVMLHSVLGGSEGPIHSLENEMNEIRWTQDRYINALIAETKLTQTTMKKLLEKHVNIYLSAEEAVKYGIADEVI
jgi:ATP-dependent Clp endopeptidase proteolytic subunit ClpP